MKNQNYRKKCQVCGRYIMTVLGRGNPKRLVRHKCPHGKWCRSGHPLKGLHINRPTQFDCPECLKYYKQHEFDT